MRTISNAGSHISDVGKAVKVYKTVKTIRLIKLGVQEANPVTAFIGAVIDVAECAGAYMQYMAVKEETKQLQAQIDTLKTQLFYQF